MEFLESPPEAHIEHTRRGSVGRILGFVKGKLLPFLGRRWKLLTVIAVILLPIIALFWWLFVPNGPEYILATARKGDLIQTVEAVGTVISEKDLKLRFPVTGVVAEVLVDEGGSVVKDQELARLRNEALQADVNAAYANLASKRAALQELTEGSRPEDIAISEAKVENKRASLAAAYAAFESAGEKLATSNAKLEKLQKEAETSLAGYISTASSTASEELTTVHTALNKLDDVFLDNALRNKALYFESSRFGILQKKIEDTKNEFNPVMASLPSGFDNYREALATLESARKVAVAVSTVITKSYTFVSNLDLAGEFTGSARETHKTTLSTQSSNVQDALSTINSTTKSLRDASANFDTKIAAEEHNVASAEGTKDSALADILTYETALCTEEAELALKKAGARQTDIDDAQAKVNQAAAELKRAKAKFEDTILCAPIDGTITKVNLKPGEFTGGLDLQEYSFSMLGASPYRVEMYVAEIDIPKVQLSQTGSIELDAFPNDPFVIRVSEIDPAATDVDGVSKYRVKLDFSEQNERLKIGMTGDGEIFTDRRDDVVYIPGRAVITTDEGEIVRILTDQNVVEEQTVVTGMEGEGGDVEIIEGVEEDETIILLIKD